MRKDTAIPMIPPAVSLEPDRAARAQRRTAELTKCQELITALLEEYDATFVVTELAAFPQGIRTVRHSIDVVTR